jgi:hypothetical protein
VVDGKGTKHRLTLPDKLTWANYIHIEESGDMSKLCRPLATEQILVVSDGSVKDNQAAAAWILTTESLDKISVLRIL